jgi:uncharacterized protein (DUF1499 family)
MSARYYQHNSQMAEWSARIGLLFLFLFALTFGFHRFSKLSTPAAMQLFGVAIAGAVVALGLGIAAFVGIWRDGNRGAHNAAVGVLAAIGMLALPVWSLPALLWLPRLHEVSTDTARPPAFNRLADRNHIVGANPVIYQREGAALQLAAYPDLKPLIINRSSDEAYTSVRAAAEALGWKIISEQAPTDTQSGIIEATDRTMVFGFIDDVVIRVTSAGRDTRVDVRSSSRHGQHDLGRNAARVRSLFTEVKFRIGEVERVERMERAVAVREKRVKQALAEKEAAAKEKARQEKLAAARAAKEARERQAANSANGGPGGLDSTQNRSGSAFQDEQGQNRRRQQQGPSSGVGKFWEQLFR